jgi:putative NADH-flavin reductase
MKTLGIQKIVVCSSLGASGSHHHLSFVGRLFIKSVLRKPMIDHTAQEEALRESDREWVVVRPPRLIDGKRTEKYRLAEEEETFNARQISLSDVAHFMLRSLQETTWNQKSISISD